MTTDWIDSHFHVFRPPAAPLPGSRYVPAYGASLAQWQALAQAQGVTRGVLVQTSFLGTDNQQLVEALVASEGRLRGVAVVRPDASAAELQVLHDAGVRGIRLNLVGADASALAQVRLPDPLVAQLLALGWHVEVHTYAGMLPRVLPQLDARLPVVLDHFGKPASQAGDDATLVCVTQRLQAGAAPVWVKLSGVYRNGGLDPAALAAHWRARLGAQQLLWGSDWPCTNHEAQADYPRLLAALAQWLPDAAQRRLVLHDNPRRLFWGA